MASDKTREWGEGRLIVIDEWGRAWRVRVSAQERAPPTDADDADADDDDTDEADDDA